MDHATMMSRLGRRFSWVWIVVGAMFSSDVGASECDAWGEPDFFQAASASRVQACLLEGTNVLARTGDGETPLHLAAGYSKDPEIIALLVAAGADPAHRRGDGWTPMHMAARYSASPEMLVALVLSGGDVNAIVDAGPRRLRDRIAFARRGTTPLMIAAQASRPHGILSTLIAAGADLDAMDRNRRTALHYAARDHGNPAITALLIAAEAEVDAADDEGWTPLHLAATRNQNAMVTETLLRGGADADATAGGGQTPIQQAAGHNTAEVLGLLFTHASDPCEPDDDGRAAFRLAEANDLVFGTAEYWELHNRCYGEQ